MKKEPKRLGRPPLPYQSVAVKLTLKPSDLAALDQWAAKLETSRADAARQLLRAGMAAGIFGVQ